MADSLHLTDPHCPEDELEDRHDLSPVTCRPDRSIRTSPPRVNWYKRKQVQCVSRF